jgi:hypothetical protein
VFFCVEKFLLTFVNAFDRMLSSKFIIMPGVNKEFLAAEREQGRSRSISFGPKLDQALKEDAFDLLESMKPQLDNLNAELYNKLKAIIDNSYLGGFDIHGLNIYDGNKQKFYCEHETERKTIVRNRLIRIIKEQCFSEFTEKHLKDLVDHELSREQSEALHNLYMKSNIDFSENLFEDIKAVARDCVEEIYREERVNQMMDENIKKIPIDADILNEVKKQIEEIGKSILSQVDHMMESENCDETTAINRLVEKFNEQAKINIYSKKYGVELGIYEVKHFMEKNPLTRQEDVIKILTKEKKIESFARAVYKKFENAIKKQCGMDSYKVLKNFKDEAIKSYEGVKIDEINEDQINNIENILRNVCKTKWDINI